MKSIGTCVVDQESLNNDNSVRHGCRGSKADLYAVKITSLENGME